MVNATTIPPIGSQTGSPRPNAESTVRTAEPSGHVQLLQDAVDNAGSQAWIGRALSAPLRRAWLDVEHIGISNVPTTGPVVLAANHLSFIDSVLVMYSLDRPVSFLGKSEYLDHPVAGRLFPMTGMLPLDRSGRHARITLNRVHEILSDGGVVGVHPEGTRSRDGRLNPGHPGVAQMALRANAPIVPVALVGTDIVQPVGQRIPKRRGQVQIRFGEPIGMGRWLPQRRTRRAREELTEEVMASIAALSGQERVPVEDVPVPVTV